MNNYFISTSLFSIIVVLSLFSTPGQCQPFSAFGSGPSFGSVQSMTTKGNDIIVSAYATFSSLQIWKSSTYQWQAFERISGVAGQVYSLVYDSRDDSVWIGGSFNAFSANQNTSFYLARHFFSTNKTEATNVPSNISSMGISTITLGPRAGTIYFTADFSNSIVASIGGIGFYDATTGNGTTTWLGGGARYMFPSLNYAYFKELRTYKNLVLAVGYLLPATGPTSGFLSIWNGENWQIIQYKYFINSFFVDSSNDLIYLATTMQGNQAGDVTVWNGEDLVTIGTSFLGGVTKIRQHPTTKEIYVCGDFTMTSTRFEMPRLCKFTNNTSWTALGDSGNPSCTAMEFDASGFDLLITFNLPSNGIQTTEGVYAKYITKFNMKRPVATDEQSNSIKISLSTILIVFIFIFIIIF